MPRKRMTETELAERVIAYLEDLKYEIWQEVQPQGGRGRRCDIVAKQGQYIVCLECKMTMNLTVIQQAANWTRYAHYSYIVTPTQRRAGLDHWFIQRILEYFGIGWLKVSRNGSNIYEEVKPRLNRKCKAKIFNHVLVEEAKSFGVAGSQHSEVYTPFKCTCRALRSFLTQHPGSTIKEVVNGIQHHYSNNTCAMTSLLKWIDDGVIDFVRIDRSTRPYRLCVKKEND